MSAINKIVLYFGQCITICGPEFQRTSVIAYSYFCLLYKCFSFVRRTLLCCHHCFKFSGNDWLRNRDGGVGTCCWTLATVKLCRFRYWYTGIIYVSLILPNVVSFFYKYEGKRRFVIAFKIVIGLCYCWSPKWNNCPKCNKVLNVITFGPKCNKALNVITFGPKCNKPPMQSFNCANIEMLKWQLLHQRILWPIFMEYCGLTDINQRLFIC